jgi:hypothetical protein
MQSESEILDDVLRTIGSRPDIRVWRAATGVARFGTTVVRFGIPGQADISGIAPDGRRIEIETKAARGYQSKQQKNFERMITKFGGVYILARSADEALAGLRERGYCR